MIGGAIYGNLAANTTEWTGVFGPRLRAAELVCRQVIPFACRLTNLSIRGATAPGGVETVEIAVILDGAPSALQQVCTGAQVIAGPDLSIVPIAAGQEISMRLSSSLNAAASTWTWSIEVIR